MLEKIEVLIPNKPTKIYISNFSQYLHIHDTNRIPIYLPLRISQFLVVESLADLTDCLYWLA